MTTRQIGPVRSYIQPAALEALVRYDWPGNVRELANVLERAQILAEEHVITLDDLPENLAASVAPVALVSDNPRSLREVERCHVQEVLKEEQGNKVHAARALGISRRALYRLISKYDLES